MSARHVSSRKIVMSVRTGPSGRTCVECRWCEVRIGFDHDSCYFCSKRRELLTGPILRRPACSDFIASGSAGAEPYSHAPDSERRS